MFTGIIECVGQVEDVVQHNQNLEFTIRSAISHDLHIDQSVSHNGVCLTVTAVSGDLHRVVAVAETLARTNLSQVKTGEALNLERCTKANSFLDGHIVQGHVDTVATCLSIEDKFGSFEYTFALREAKPYLLIDKGSIAINGVSLTVINPAEDTFTVAMIPYTLDHTTFKNVNVGHIVNIEYDVIGKYVARIMAFKP